MNPLSWIPEAAAPAALNLGSLPGIAPGEDLAAPIAALTGATCAGGVLQVDIPWSRRPGFADLLSLFGSYHVYDYNLFYLNIRQNAKARLMAYRAAHGGGNPAEEPGR